MAGRDTRDAQRGRLALGVMLVVSGCGGSSGDLGPPASYRIQAVQGLTLTLPVATKCSGVGSFIAKEGGFFAGQTPNILVVGDMVVGDLGTESLDAFFVSAVNDSGLVVGTDLGRAFSQLGSKRTHYNGLEQGARSEALAASSAGTVVGRAWSGEVGRPVLYRKGQGAVALAGSAGRAVAVTKGGMVLVFLEAAPHLFRWHLEKLVPIQGPGAKRVAPVDMNESGTVLGVIVVGEMARAVVAIADRFVELPLPDGFVTAGPVAINGHGVVVANGLFPVNEQLVRRPIVYYPGRLPQVIEDVHATEAFGIDDHGRILVRRSSDGTTELAWLVPN